MSAAPDSKTQAAAAAAEKAAEPQPTFTMDVPDFQPAAERSKGKAAAAASSPASAAASSAVDAELAPPAAAADAAAETAEADADAEAGDTEQYEDDEGFQPEDRTKLVVNYLPWSVDEEALRAMFAEFGEVEQARLVVNNATHASLGYGFVKFATEADAQSALLEVNKRSVLGREVALQPYSSKRHGSSKKDEQPQQQQQKQEQTPSERAPFVVGHPPRT